MTQALTATSKDGTRIAFEQSGAGPTVILVSAALSDRKDLRKLARHLAKSFTVINYDRRGRGESTDTLPYAVEREVDDLQALVGAAREPAYLFGSSSGSVLALEAASQLGASIRGAVLYEPPFIVDGSRPPMAEDLAERIGELVSAGRRSDAVRLFFHQGMGIPGIFVSMMRLFMPGWNKMAAAAHTLNYDLEVLAGTQSGKALPVERWAASKAPTLVLVGGKSEPFFHSGARALANALPHVRYDSLQGGHHGSVVTAPKAVAAAVERFFEESSKASSAGARRARNSRDARPLPD